MTTHITATQINIPATELIIMAIVKNTIMDNQKIKLIRIIMVNHMIMAKHKIMAATQMIMVVAIQRMKMKLMRVTQNYLAIRIKTIAAES